MPTVRVQQYNKKILRLERQFSLWVLSFSERPWTMYSVALWSMSNVVKWFTAVSESAPATDVDCFDSEHWSKQCVRDVSLTDNVRMRTYLFVINILVFALPYTLKFGDLRTIWILVSVELGTKRAKCSVNIMRRGWCSNAAPQARSSASGFQQHTPMETDLRRVELGTIGKQHFKVSSKILLLLLPYKLRLILFFKILVI